MCICRFPVQWASATPTETAIASKTIARRLRAASSSFLAARRKTSPSPINGEVDVFSAGAAFNATAKASGRFFVLSGGFALSTVVKTGVTKLWLLAAPQRCYRVERRYHRMVWRNPWSARSSAAARRSRSAPATFSVAMSAAVLRTDFFRRHSPQLDGQRCHTDCPRRPLHQHDSLEGSKQVVSAAGIANTAVIDMRHQVVAHFFWSVRLGGPGTASGS